MKRPAILMLLFGLLWATVLVSLTLGRFPITLTELYDVMLQLLLGCEVMAEERFSTLTNILFDIRLPRIMAAVLTGAALSVAGASFQSMFINPLVSPGLLGVLAGASFGAALGMVAARTWLAVEAGAFIFGLAAVIVAMAIARFFRGDRLLILILGGIISASLFTSLLSLIKYLADPYDQLPAIVFWLMGGFSMVDGKTVLFVALPMLVGIAVLLALSITLNVLSMGEEEARALGINVGVMQTTIILSATLISSLTVSLGGIVGWVGLVIPHVGRMLVGPDNRVLLPVAGMLGATYLLGVDDLSRLLFRVEIPIGILTSLLGIPFFMLVLKNARKGWS